MGYYFYHAEKQKIFIARRAVFLEEEYLLQEASGSRVYLQEVVDSQTVPESFDDSLTLESVQMHTKEPRRSSRVPREPYRYVGHIDKGLSQVHYSEDDDPKTYEQALGISG